MNRSTPLFFILLFFVTSFSNTVKPNYNQQSYSRTPDKVDYYDHYLLDQFCAPLQFTRSGIQHFFQDVFNHKKYSREYLPHNFTHFLEFLEYGIETNQSTVYLESSIRLFLNKLKGSRYVSPYAFSDMLTKLPLLLKDYCLICPPSITFAKVKKGIKKILYSMFLSKFSYFSSEPDDFFNDLSDDILTHIEQCIPLKETIQKEQLKQTLIRFLEIGLIKLVWSPIDQENVWDSVKEISANLLELQKSNIINDDELDDLYKSLLESFCHFLELAGSELSPEVIEIIKDDITSGQMDFFQLEEQEMCIETKEERMVRAIVETEAKVYARMKGILTDQMLY